jgi:hypothetical protein
MLGYNCVHVTTHTPVEVHLLQAGLISSHFTRRALGAYQRRTLVWCQRQFDVLAGHAASPDLGSMALMSNLNGCCRHSLYRMRCIVGNVGIATGGHGLMRWTTSHKVENQDVGQCLPLSRLGCIVSAVSRHHLSSITEHRKTIIHLGHRLQVRRADRQEISTYGGRTKIRSRHRRTTF